MTQTNLTKTERNALRLWWGMELRIRNGNVELKKGNCWGVLCDIEQGKKEAQIIINNLKK